MTEYTPVFSTVVEACIVDPIAAVTFGYMLEEKEREAKAQTERLETMIAEIRKSRTAEKVTTGVASVEKNTGESLKMPLEQTPEDFIAGIFYHEPTQSTNIDLGFHGRLEEYKTLCDEQKKGPLLGQTEQKKLWAEKMNELQTVRNKQVDAKKMVAETKEEGQIEQEDYWTGVIPTKFATYAEVDPLRRDFEKYASTKNNDAATRIVQHVIGPAASEPDNFKAAWTCDGCCKSFSTKASLQRHIERKAGCKTITENKVDDSFLENNNEPIAEWVEEMLKKSISGQTEAPLCKSCEIEFANKSNLMKHLSKTPACNKLAKIAFLKLVYDSIDAQKVPEIANKLLAKDKSCNVM